MPEKIILVESAWIFIHSMLFSTAFRAALEDKTLAGESVGRVWAKAKRRGKQGTFPLGFLKETSDWEKGLEHQGDNSAKDQTNHPFENEQFALHTMDVGAGCQLRIHGFRKG